MAPERAAATRRRRICAGGTIGSAFDAKKSTGGKSCRLALPCHARERMARSEDQASHTNLSTSRRGSHPMGGNICRDQTQRGCSPQHHKTAKNTRTFAAISAVEVNVFSSTTPAMRGLPLLLVAKANWIATAPPRLEERRRTSEFIPARNTRHGHSRA